MGILKSVAANLLHEKADRVIAAETELRKARRSGAAPATVRGAEQAVEQAESARKTAEKAFRNADG